MRWSEPEIPTLVMYGMSFQSKYGTLRVVLDN